jgi:hypothetical protein
MATITTLKAGNWSDPTVWNGGVLPGVNDYAQAGHAVVIDQDITVLGLRITANINGFTVSGSTTRTINLTATDAIAYTTSAGTWLNITNTGTTNITTYFTANANNVAQSYISCNSTGGTININILGGWTFPINSGGSPVFFTGTSSNQIVNITGDIFENNLAQPALQILGTNNTVNMTGNIATSTQSAQVNSILVASGSVNNKFNLTGNISGVGTFLTTTNTTLSVSLNGILQGGSVNNMINSSSTATFKVSGIISQQNNVNPIFVKKIRIDSALDTTWTYNTDVVGVNKTLYTSGTAQGQPAINNVRSGTVYGANSEYTGTLIMATPANVRKGVPTDATVGTADLTVNDFWNKLTSELTTSGSVGKLLTDNVDTQISTRATDSGVISELNTSSTDVAVRMRNVSTVGITGQQLAGQG